MAEVINMEVTNALVDARPIDYTLAENGHVSPTSDSMENLRHSLSTLQEVNSVGSDHMREQMNGSLGYDAQVAEEDEEDYADEIEITDGDPPENDGGFHRDVRGANDPRIPNHVPRTFRYRDLYERRPPQYDYPAFHMTPNISDSLTMHKKSRQKGAKWHREELTILPNVAYDYWTLPRSKTWIRDHSDGGDGRYQTPSGLLHSRRSHGHRSSKRSHKTRSSKSGKHGSSSIENEMIIEKDLTNKTNEQTTSNADSLSATSPQRSELKVYFRFSKGLLSESGVGDYTQNEPLLEALQAHCRGWLARQNYERLLDQHEAVQIIQRNSERIFNPWVRLMLALRPLLKTHRIEEELLYLRSELERYKTLVKMLRFENAEYQAKVANLLHLIEQINTKGTESPNVNNLVIQISEALSKNQEFWQEMAAANKALQSTTITKPAYMETEGSPLIGKAAPSPITQLRQNADFYRNQVEMLKEEADEQQHRSSEHFQGQVRVLSDRVEHLQSLLALESSKVERLSNELEEMNNTIVDAKVYERNLEHMVSQLSKQLDQRTKAQEQAAAEKIKSDTPITTVESDLEPGEQHELEKQLNSYRELIGHLRTHLSANPKAMTLLANTPFQPGGQLDLFNEPPPPGQNYTLVTPTINNKFFASPSPVDHVDHRSLTGDLTPRTVHAKEVEELKRQLTTYEKQLADLDEQMKHETEDRETLENENMQLLSRISTLTNQLRNNEDEYDKTLTNREMAYQRKLKELTDQLEEELSKTSRLSNQNRDLEMQLTALRNAAEPDDDILSAEWESMQSKLRADVAHYKQSYELLREEFEQFRAQHDSADMQQQLNEKEEKINLLESEKQQWRMELQVLQVKLQNATSLLEDTEGRLKMVNRERTAQMHRVTQLENERDEAIREAAKIAGRASAERETASSKLREFEELRAQRDALSRELTELKQVLAGSTAENATEKRQLQARLRELETHHEARILDFKTELERTREKLELLQVELQTAQTAEREQKALNQQNKRKIDELEDQLSLSNRRITTLERHNTDLDTELVRTKADLSVSREAISLRRAACARMADEWSQAMNDGDSITEEEKNTTGSDLVHDSQSEEYSTASRWLRNTGTRNRSSLRDTKFSRITSPYRSNPNLLKENLFAMGDRSAMLRGSLSTLDKVEDRSSPRDQFRTQNGYKHGLPRSSMYTKADVEQFEASQEEKRADSTTFDSDTVEESES